MSWGIFCIVLWAFVAGCLFCTSLIAERKNKLGWKQLLAETIAALCWPLIFVSAAILIALIFLMDWAR